MDQSTKNLALDLWEIAHDFGTQPVSPAQWVARYRKDVKFDSGLRAWERLKAKIHASPFPVEFVEIEDWATSNLGERRTRGDNTSLASYTYRSRSLGIRLSRGSLREYAKILDAANGVTHDDE